MKRREFLKFSSYLLGFLGISSLSFGKKEYKENSNDNYKKNKEIKKYNRRGNLIYHKDSFGQKNWRKYDENNNWIYIYTYTGIYNYTGYNSHEQWAEYDEKNRMIYYKSSLFNYERWFEYDKNNNRIYYKARI